MRKHILPNSIQTCIPLLMLSIIVPLLLFLVVYNIYSAYSLQNQAAILGKNTISLFGNQMNSVLGMIDKSLLGTEVEDRAISSSHTTLSDQRILAQMRIRITLKELLGTYEFLDGVFTYSPEDDLLTSSMVNYDDLTKKQSLIIQTKVYAQKFEMGEVSRWTGIQIGENFYLLRILRRGTYDIGVWIDISKFLEYLGNSEIQKLDHVGLVSSSGTALFPGYPEFSDQFDMEKSQQNFGSCQLNGETYNTIATPVGRGELSLVALLRTTNILGGVSTFQNVISLITAALFVASPLFLLFLNRRIVAPARQICTVMQNFGHGDLSIRFQNTKVYEEFQLIGTTFNQMASEISRLKIADYEKQLAIQRTEMQFLQLQLTPHFYINSLNIIYSLAQISDFSTIQKMVLALTQYFRYSLKSHSDLVPLKDELCHMESYIAIQKMRYSNRFSVNCHIPTELESMKVPLFLLQTFVENSMKYAFTGDNTVQVDIEAYLSPQNELVVSIRDNGPGYPACVLDGSLMKNPKNIHIGIENVRNRLALLYQDRATLTLSNPPTGGALTTVIIPEPQGGIRHDTSSDC